MRGRSECSSEQGLQAAPVPTAVTAQPLCPFTKEGKNEFMFLIVLSNTNRALLNKTAGATGRLGKQKASLVQGGLRQGCSSPVQAGLHLPVTHTLHPTCRGHIQPHPSPQTPFPCDSLSHKQLSWGLMRHRALIPVTITL